MKSIIVLAAIAIFVNLDARAESTCDPVGAGRDAIKMLLVLESAPAVKQICGNANGDDKYTVVNVLPQYHNSTEDLYRVVVRNTDCRVLEVELNAEGQSASKCD